MSGPAPRAYDAIVRDLLTLLTGGTIGEAITVPAGDQPVLRLAKLRDRPVRRISYLEGRPKDGDEDARIRFTDADFELVSTSEDGTLDAIAFRDGGRRPQPGSTLSVNYYPVQTRPAPVNDLNVGSVVRTLLETVSRELALTYHQLDHVYQSGFVETAEDRALEGVVALVGVRRLTPGSPVVRIRVRRAPDAIGRVTVPANTALAGADGARYLTAADITLEPGEPFRDVLASGERPDTPLVDADALREEVRIAGVTAASNPEPAYALTGRETDPELRLRARGALHGTARGTVDALRFWLRSIDGVKDVTIDEGVGEIAVTVAYERDDPDVRAAVVETIREVRPAGIRVRATGAERVVVNAEIALTLAGSGATGSELSALRDGAVQRVTDVLRATAPGATVRRAQLSAALLADARIVDATVTLTPGGAELQLEPGTALQVGTVLVASVTSEAAAPPPTAQVSAVIPLHLLPGITAAAATDALQLAFDAHLATIRPDLPLTVDGLLAAVKDDTRYAIVRAEVTVTIEAGGRFVQLTDAAGVYTPVAGEQLARADLAVDPRDG